MEEPEPVADDRAVRGHGSGGQTPVQPTCTPAVASRPSAMTATAAAAKAIRRPGRRKARHSRRRSSVVDMRRLYGSARNTARTGPVMPVLGRGGHAGGVFSLRRGTVGARFTVLYALVFLVSGIGLLGVTFLLAGSSVSNVAPGNNPPVRSGPDAAQERIRELQDQVAVMQTQQNRQLLAASLIALILMALISPVLGRVLARRVLRPLRHITTATRRISADSLDRRLAVERPDRRGQGARRHHRRAARTARGVVRRAAPLRRQRLARAAHATDHRAGRAGRGGRQARPGRVDRRAGGPRASAAGSGRAPSRRASRAGPGAARSVRRRRRGRPS